MLHFIVCVCVCVCGMVAIITIVYVYKGGYILVRVCMCMLVSCYGYAEEMTCLSDQHVVYWIFLQMTCNQPLR